MITTLLFDYIRVLFMPIDQSSLEDTDLPPLNFALLDFLHPLRDLYDLYIFTSGHVPDDPQLHQYLDPIFSQNFTTTQVGQSKSDPDSFRTIAELLEKQGNELLFVDDAAVNVEAARRAGLTAIHYQTVEQTKNAIITALTNQRS